MALVEHPCIVDVAGALIVAFGIILTIICFLGPIQEEL